MDRMVQNMEVNVIMSKPPVSVELDDPLSIIKEIFDKTCFHHLVVVNSSGKLQGVISDRDLLKALSPSIGTLAETTKDQRCLNKKAHQIMSRKPVSLKTQSNITEAVSIFNKHCLSCIPIIDHQLKPIGILSWRDIMKTVNV